MPSSCRHAGLLLAVGLALGCAAPPRPDAAPDATEPPATPAEAPGEAVAPVDADGTYLRPNLRFDDGEEGFVHVRPEDMPLRVAIGLPKSAPRYASRSRTRELSIEAMRMWETAIRPHVPWFRLEFCEKDPSAAVQVVWKRKITGPYAGFGGWRWWREEGRLRVGGRMEVSTTPSDFSRLEVDEVVLLIAHEFGHVLGLGHCLECDSAMNYAWNTRDRILVTELDARTFAALVAQPIHPRLLPAAGEGCRDTEHFTGEARARLAELLRDEELDQGQHRCLSLELDRLRRDARVACRQGAPPAFEDLLGDLRERYEHCVDATMVEQAVAPPGSS